MDDLIRLVKTYRITTGIAERALLAEQIILRIASDLRLFVFAAIQPPVADDVAQEVLKAVATGMGKFAGSSNEQFWAWCYQIARNKLNDHYRKQANTREQQMPQDEFWQLVESSAQVSPLSPADRHDLEYAMQLLTRSKPECYDYLWQHFVFGLNYDEIAGQHNVSYDAARMKIGRCLDEAQSLVT